MARTPPVPLTKAEKKLEIKLRKMLRDKKFKETKIALKKLNANSAGRKMLRAVFGFGLRIAGSRLLWLGALGYAGFEYGPQLLEMLKEDSGASDDERNQALNQITNALPDQDPLVDVDEFVDISQEPEIDISERYTLTPDKMAARQRQPTGTFARGRQETRFTPGLDPGYRQTLLGREDYEQYTPSGNIGLLEERTFQPDRVIGPRPQPVETPWAEGGAAYGVPDVAAQIDKTQLGMEGLTEQRRLEEEVLSSQRPSAIEDVLMNQQTLAPPTPDTRLPVRIPPPTIPSDPTGPEQTMEGQRGPTADWTGKQYERMPTAEEAASGAFDFLPLAGEEIQSISETGEITDDEGTLRDMAERLTGEELLTSGAKALAKTTVGVVGKSVEIVGDLIGKAFSGGDVTEEDAKNQIYVDLDTGRVITEGEDPAQVKGVASESAKEEGKALNQKAQDQANVARVAQNYGLNPAIKDTLSQIERNASILRATSVMMGVKDISSNYRDMSIGQLRLARDIVEDLNEGTKGPWIEWNLPDGTKVHLPRTGANSKPPEGASQTDPNIARYKDTAQLREIKGLVKAGKPWDAYNLIIQYGLGSTFKDAHTNASEMMTMFWREANPNLPLGFKWPTWPNYENWQLLRADDPGDADSAFQEMHGGFLPLGR
jgi:hypothetical protein